MLKITVITVCYNDREKLRKTIESVCSQTYDNIEYLIIDGASMDGTAEMVQKYIATHSINFYSEKDYGIYNAMNRGVTRASGDYVVFLNAGDIFYNDQVVADVAFCIGEERETIYYGKTCRIYADGLKQIEDYTKSGISLEQILADGDMPCHQSIFAPRRSLINHYFREQYRIRADYEWLLHSVINGFAYQPISIIICYYEMSGVSSRLKTMRILKKEEKEILKEYHYVLEEKKINLSKENMEDTRTTALKYIFLFQFMNYWLTLKQKNLSVGKLLRDKGYKRIAIYGMSHMGFSLCKELAEWDIKIDYAIDQNASEFCMETKIVSPEESLDKVDAVIVTALEYYSEIKEMLEKKLSCPILSFEDLIYEIEENDKQRKELLRSKAIRGITMEK